ncbi:hypothetical protein EVA_03342 [gut metagenome]|uniref:Uncharacterized protein n=1 Tax=gut metagenome TaxID=749906 RepID=J9GL39_9ZZZZ
MCLVEFAVSPFPAGVFGIFTAMDCIFSSLGWCILLICWLLSARFSNLPGWIPG